MLLASVELICLFASPLLVRMSNNLWSILLASVELICLFASPLLVRMSKTLFLMSLTSVSLMRPCATALLVMMSKALSSILFPSTAPMFRIASAMAAETWTFLSGMFETADRTASAPPIACPVLALKASEVFFGIMLIAPASSCTLLVSAFVVTLMMLLP